MGSDSLEIPKVYLNEIPIEFHLFTGLTLLGASLGRNVFAPRGVYEIYPAMLTTLVSPTGICKKTTACNIGMKILRNSGQTKIISERVSPEALVTALQRSKPVLKRDKEKGTQKIVPEVMDSTAIIFAPELSTFIDKRDYNAGLIPLITRLADCPDVWSSETIGRGKDTLRNVALASLWATAPVWLLGMPDVMFSGGFIARCLYVCRMFPTGPVDTPTPLCKEMSDDLTREMIQLGQLKGPIESSPETLNWFKNWYANKFYPYKSHDEKRAAYQERKPDHLYRLALIIAISKCHDQIELVDIKESLNILEAIEGDMFHLFGTIERVASTAGWVMEIVLKRIKRVGRIMHTDLLRNMVSRGMTREDMQVALGSLCDAGFVKEEEEVRKKGRNPKFYRYIGGEDKDDLTDKKKGDGQDENSSGNTDK
jgi:hypothetical protein